MKKTIRSLAALLAALMLLGLCACGAKTAPAEAEEKAPAEPEAESAAPAEAADPFANLSATRQINLDELKFGRNYNT